MDRIPSHEWKAFQPYGTATDHQLPVDRIPVHEWRLPSLAAVDVVLSYCERNRQTGEIDVLYNFTVHNTYIRTFDDGDGEYDHIFYRREAGDYEAMPLHHPHYEEMKQRLIMEGFPHYHDKSPDESTLGWHAALKAKGWDNLTKPA